MHAPGKQLWHIVGMRYFSQSTIICFVGLDDLVAIRCVSVYLCLGAVGSARLACSALPIASCGMFAWAPIPVSFASHIARCFAELNNHYEEQPATKRFLTYTMTLICY